MNSSQHIHCTVESCRYNEQSKDCSLDAIQVAPRSNTSTCQDDESLCASYSSRE